MRKAKEIFKSFPNKFVADFTATCLCSVKHPVLGNRPLTKSLVKYSPAEYKNAIYNNICEQIDAEIEMVNSEVYEGAKNEPIVASPLIKLLARHVVDGIHELNSWVKYPELMKIAQNLSKENIDMKTLPIRVREEVAKVDSEMSYKAQFVWEELGKILGFECA